MNFYQKLGPLIFGTRLKRLSDYFLSEVNKVYVDLGIPFEASWFGVFYLLKQNESLSIIDIAETLEISHSAVSQLVKNLENKKLVEVKSSDYDGRKKLMRLTAEGTVLLEKIIPVWDSLSLTMADLLDNEQGKEALSSILAIETAFQKQNLSERLKSSYELISHHL
jgi:DNA-binding MarR family transcriptional regulator